ncbi:hypothetical protein FOC1_h10016829, partial [Fusarium oxysporum f. sp. cubense race 1]
VIVKDIHNALQITLIPDLQHGPINGIEEEELATSNFEKVECFSCVGCHSIVRPDISVNATSPYLIFHLTTLAPKHVPSHILVGIDPVRWGRDLEFCRLATLGCKKGKVMMYPIVGHHYAVGNCGVLTHVGQQVCV